MIHTITIWVLGAVAAVAVVAGAPAAASTAGKALGTVGIVVGSVAGGADNLITGFNQARNSADDAGSGGGLFGSPDKPKGKPNKQQRNNR